MGLGLLHFVTSRQWKLTMLQGDGVWGAGTNRTGVSGAKRREEGGCSTGTISPGLGGHQCHSSSKGQMICSWRRSPSPLLSHYLVRDSCNRPWHAEPWGITKEAKVKVSVLPSLILLLERWSDKNKRCTWTLIKNKHMNLPWVMTHTWFTNAEREITRATEVNGRWHPWRFNAGAAS